MVIRDAAEHEIPLACKMTFVDVAEGIAIRLEILDAESQLLIETDESLILRHAELVAIRQVPIDLHRANMPLRVLVREAAIKLRAAARPIRKQSHALLAIELAARDHTAQRQQDRARVDIAHLLTKAQRRHH